MSRGVLDQAAFDAATAATAWAEAHGKRALWDAIHYADDGTRTFRFRFEAVKRDRKSRDRPAPDQNSQPVTDSRGPALKRGGVPKPVQEEMSL